MPSILFQLGVERYGGLIFCFRLTAWHMLASLNVLITTTNATIKADSFVLKPKDFLGCTTNYTSYDLTLLSGYEPVELKLYFNVLFDTRVLKLSDFMTFLSGKFQQIVTNVIRTQTLKIAVHTKWTYLLYPHYCKSVTFIGLIRPPDNFAAKIWCVFRILMIDRLEYLMYLSDI